MPDRHIFLIGMQGCGKSSLGKRVARETGIPFADTDAIVAQSIRGTVNDFFALYGEEKFRRAETGALALLTSCAAGAGSYGSTGRWRKSFRISSLTGGRT